VAALLGSLTLMLSVGFDFGYLLVLGVSFGEIQTTITDHLRSAIIWMPAAAIALVLQSLVFIRVTPYLEKLEASDDGEQPSRARLRVFRYLLIGISFFALVIFLVRVSVLGWIVVALSVLLWAMYFIVVSLEAVRRTFFGVLAWGVFLMLVLLLGLIVTGGAINAHSILRYETPKWQMVVEGPSGIHETIDLVGTRRFEQTVIAVDTRKIVHLFPSSRVLEVKQTESTFSNVPRPCKWFGVFCYDIQ
jgi:hypothetical protein